MKNVPTPSIQSLLPHTKRPACVAPRRFVLASVALLCAAGCNWNSFDKYVEQAPIRVHPTPSNYGLSSYGARIATLQTSLAGKQVSTIFASAGGTTPVAISRAWTGSAVTETGPQLRCHLPGECMGGTDIGAALIPFETWGANSATPLRNCVFAPSNSMLPWSANDGRLGGEGFVLCEGSGTVHFAMNEAFLAARANGATMEFSGFGLPSKHPLGVVIYGAFATDNSTSVRHHGGLYVQADFVEAAPGMAAAAPLALAVPLIDPATKAAFTDDPAVGDFGRQVSGSLDANGVLVIAISQPSRQRVLVASYEGSLPGDPIERFRLRACIAAPDSAPPGFGERALVGDVTGDGLPELFIGNDPAFGASPGKQALFMYAGAGLPPAVSGDTCPAWNQAAVPVVCADRAGLRCSGSAFGASLAIGDVDGDQKGDLLVGAPNTTVDGASEAGAVWVLPGRADGLALDRAVTLDIGGSAKAHLGAAVAALHTNKRDEPVAGAPGEGKLFVFMCTPLETGYGDASECLP